MRTLGAFVVRRSKLVLIATVLFLVLGGVIGTSVADHLSTGGFEDPHSESTIAAARIEERFGIADPDFVLLVTSQTGSVDDLAVVAAGRALTKELAAEPAVTRVESYWSLGGAPPLRSLDGSEGLVLATLKGTENDKHRALDTLSPKYSRTDDNLKISVGGFAEVFRQVTAQVEEDLIKAELIAVPILLLMLLFVFRSPVAASLPLGVGLVAVLGTLLILRALAAVTEVSVFALNLTTGMGLGLGIDYSLFVVSRFREEVAAGRSKEEAVIRTVETAGRTVAFSAIAVAASLSALLLFPIVFLRSFAYSGIPVVALAAVGATITLPALLMALGQRIDSFSIRHRPVKPIGEGVWHRIAMIVMRRPLPIATVGVAVLLFLGSPFLGVNLGLPDDRVLPPGAPGREVSDRMRVDFSGNEAFAISVLAEGLDVRTEPVAVDAYAAELSLISGIARVDAATGSYVFGVKVLEDDVLSERFTTEGSTFFSAVLAPGIETQSPAAEEVVHSIRDSASPVSVQVGGASAGLVDGKSVAFARFPLALGWISIVTFVTLFLLFGSILVPIKAVLLNLLSLTATFGAMVWVFQDGHLSSVLNFTPTGSIILSNIILMFCIAFGLSMDYEVFLLSRIKEEHDISGDNELSVARGLERTGRIVTAAAALIAVVFAAMLTSGVSFIKMFGLGLALAVVMDATLVRAFLVPAFMKMMGSANWWAPPPLRRLHNRFGISEQAPVEKVEV